MLISISINKYIDPDECKWYKLKNGTLKIESRKSEDILEKDDIVGIKENPKKKTQFFLVYPMALDRPIEVDNKFVKKLTNKSTLLAKVPKEALEGERNVKSGKKSSPLSNPKEPDQLNAKTPFNSDLFKPNARISTAMEKKEIDFKHYQWRKVKKKYDVYKPNGSAIAMKLNVGDIIGVRFKHHARGGFIVNLRGARHVVSDPDDYKEIVKHADLIPFNQWPKTTISAAQIEANRLEDAEETNRVHRKQIEEAAAIRKAEREEAAAKAAADAERLREEALAQKEADRLAELEFKQKAEIAKDKREAERKRLAAPAEEEELLGYILEKADNEKDVVDDDEDDDFDVSSLDEVDLEDDDDEPLTTPSTEFPELTANPDTRPIDIAKTTDDVTKTLAVKLAELKQKAKAMDLDDEDEDDLDEGDELDEGNDEDEDLDTEDENDLSDDEDLDAEDDGEEDTDVEELDEDDMEDLEDLEADEEGTEDDEDTGEEDDDEMTVEEMRETLEDEGVIGANDKLSDAEIRKRFKLSMEEEEGEADDEAYADEDDDEDDDLTDLDDLEGPTDEDLEDDSADDETDLEDLDEDVEGIDDETEASEYTPDEGDVVTFKTDTERQDEHVILDIYALPKNSNIMVYKVYNIEKEPEYFTLVKVSVDESKGFSKLVKFVRKMNGKEFMEYYIKVENYEKSNDPIVS